MQSTGLEHSVNTPIGKMKVNHPLPDLLAFKPVLWFSRKKARESGSADEKDRDVQFDVPVDWTDPENEHTTEWSIRVFNAGHILSVGNRTGGDYRQGQACGISDGHYCIQL